MNYEQLLEAGFADLQDAHPDITDYEIDRAMNTLSTKVKGEGPIIFCGQIAPEADDYQTIGEPFGLIPTNPDYSFNLVNTCFENENCPNLPYPTAQFWFICPLFEGLSTKAIPVGVNVQFIDGKISNVFFCKGSEDDFETVRFYTYENPIDFGGALFNRVCHYLVSLISLYFADKMSVLNTSKDFKHPLSRNKKRKGSFGKTVSPVIDLTRATPKLRSESLGTGSPVSPHNRRGHFRHYKSGKKVWINNCRIHGGSDDRKIYLAPA